MHILQKMAYAQGTMTHDSQRTRDSHYVFMNKQNQTCISLPEQRTMRATATPGRGAPPVLHRTSFYVAHLILLRLRSAPLHVV